MNDYDYMGLAIEQAFLAMAEDEVPVGAVIVDRSGRLVAKGFNRPISNCDPTCHAEMMAIRSAAKKIGNYRLGEMTLYVTVEPCIMCMGAIIHARIRKVVYGTPDPKWGAAGSLYNFACDTRLNHNLEIVSGVRMEETRELIQSFFKNKRSK